MYILILQGASTGAFIVSVVRTVFPLKAELRQQKARAMTKLVGFKLLIFLQVLQDLIFGLVVLHDSSARSNGERYTRLGFGLVSSLYSLSS
ncbi:hypothetical protein F5Y16DRAFT_380323 [Xylariaceae sp. FL0255]|nr:hypothetical protein F5Y16DRAFT_380323 [Xylariaceae sp. FL0255]